MNRTGRGRERGKEGGGRGRGGTRGGRERRRKVEDVNQKDGFVLFFILAFHIYL